MSAVAGVLKCTHDGTQYVVESGDFNRKAHIPL